MVTTQHACGALFSCVAGQKPHEWGSSRPSASVTPGADAMVVSKSSQYQFVLEVLYIPTKTEPTLALHLTILILDPASYRKRYGLKHLY